MHDYVDACGVTSDSVGVIAEELTMPPLAIEDIVIGKQMGTYTSASATDFN